MLYLLSIFNRMGAVSMFFNKRVNKDKTQVIDSDVPCIFCGGKCQREVLNKGSIVFTQDRCTDCGTAGQQEICYHHDDWIVNWV